MNATPELMKAAKLFADPKHRAAAFREPQTFRHRGKNIVWASDMHTMFIAKDDKGRGFRARRPIKWKGEAFSKEWWETYWPDWDGLVARIPRKRQAASAVWVNPKFLARVARAASVLKCDSAPVNLGEVSDVMTFALGDSAVIFVMPMRGSDSAALPRWLDEHCPPPLPPAPIKAKPKAKRSRR